MAKPKPAVEPQALLTEVVKEVVAALNAYQNDPNVTKGVIPKLLSADFEFKTILDIKVGGIFSFWIIKIGHTVDKQTINDVTFHYEVDPPKPAPEAINFFESVKKEPNFQNELVKTIRAAAEAVAAAKPAAGTPAPGTIVLPPFKQLVVALSFGVTQDTVGGITIPIMLTTLGLNAERNKNTVHQVKLTFADPKKP
jgi:hypothetical protein